MSQLNDFETETIEQAEFEKRTRRYFRAAKLIASARSERDSDALRRAEAFAIGAAVEYRLKVAEALQVTPPPDISENLLTQLDYAVETYPTIPDLYWDKAVIQGRFLSDFEAAQISLDLALVHGMSHPLLPRLQSLIHDADGSAKPDATPTRALLRLLFRLIHATADGDFGGVIGPTSGHNLPVNFDDYLAHARNLAKEGADTKPLFDGFEQLSSARLVTADALDYGLEFVFRATEAGSDENAARQALSELASYLRDFSFHESEGQPSGHSLRKAVRLARRGLDIVETTQVPLDPDLHADLWLALGQGTGRPGNLDVAQTFAAYTTALRLKRAASNTVDENRLVDLLKRMLDYAVQLGIAADTGISGLGEARAALEASYTAAREIGDKDQVFLIGLQYNNLLSAIAQPDFALKVLDEMLPDLEGERRVDVLLEKAMRLSEARRKREALLLHEDLEPLIKMTDARTRCIFWNSFSNALRELKLFDRALVSIDKAIAVKPDPGEYIDQLGPMLHTNRGRILLELSRPEEAEHEIDEAARLMAANAPIGDEKIRSAGLRTQVLLQKGEYTKAHDTCEHAIDQLFERLTHGGADPIVWTSMLQEWSRFDGLGMLTKVKAERPPDETLGFAEAAKGRLMRLLTRGGGDDEKKLLAPIGMMPAVEAARDWVRAESGRQILSFFCSTNVLALFTVQGAEADVTYRWMDGCIYDEFRDYVFSPWQKVTDWSLDRRIQQALASQRAPPDLLLDAAESMSGMVLDKLGSLIDELAPQLRHGGSQLVIVPHRVLRSMPLCNARLPDGRFLSQLFDEVSVAHSIAEFLNTDTDTDLRSSKAGVGPRLILDPCGDLLFARLEACDVPAERVAMGKQATRQEFLNAISEDARVLVSAHGEFCPNDPWSSQIAFSDGRMALSDLVSERRLATRLMILSCCEAGLSQSSNSDEPFGFPSILQAAGVSCVIAPTWRVDDLATCLLVSRILHELGNGCAQARAVGLASHWLRQLSVHETLDCLSGLKSGAGTGASGDSDAVLNALAEQEQWLSENFAGPEKPFDAPLYWAGLQHFGVPPAMS